MTPEPYSLVEMTDEEVAREKTVQGGLADSVRALADASLRTTVRDEVVLEVQAELQRLTARLAAEQIPGSFGVTLTRDGTVRSHGNAVVGLRNPVAPPLHVRYERSTPLGDCSAEAWIDRVEGVKTWVQAELRGADGQTTAHAQGIFILPRWARAALAERGGRPPRFE